MTHPLFHSPCTVSISFAAVCASKPGHRKDRTFWLSTLDNVTGGNRSGDVYATTVAGYGLDEILRVDGRW